MFTPENEMGVIVKFVQELESHPDTKWDLVSIRSEFPDAEIHVQGIGLLRVEFEYDAKNFISHGHDPRQCDLIICWFDSGYGGCLPVLCLANFGLSDRCIDDFVYTAPSPQAKELDYWKAQASYYMSLAAKYKQRVEILTAHEENETMCECEQCGRSFGSVQGLNAHKRFCEGA